MNSFFTWHIFLKVEKSQDLPSKIWKTLGDAHFHLLAHIIQDHLEGKIRWEIQDKI
jgi:hypothetical protein